VFVRVGVFVGGRGVLVRVGVLVGPAGVFVRVGVGVFVGPPAAFRVIRSKSGAQPDEFENRMVLFPAFRLTVVWIDPTVVQLPVLGKFSVVVAPPLTLICAERASALK
jgi:hypothetical protein